MTKHVTHEDAEQILAAVREFTGDTHATLHSADHEFQPEGCWSIALEGGPDDWPIHFSASQFMHRTITERVFIEPINNWSLGLYPA